MLKLDFSTSDSTKASFRKVNGPKVTLTESPGMDASFGDKNTANAEFTDRIEIHTGGVSAKEIDARIAKHNSSLGAHEAFRITESELDDLLK